MARIEKTIFISYRRKDISWALAVYQYLASQKYDVFFDYTHIPSGDFEQIIVSNIKARAHFVLILTPTALDRTSNEGDWLRREIETAIDEKRNVVPLFFSGFNFGSPNVTEKLTGKLSTLNRYNGLDIPSGYFMEAMERLRGRYLNIPLDAVIHPVSTQVRKAVKEEKIAANKALKKREDIKLLVQPAEEKSEKYKQPPDKKEVAPLPSTSESRISLTENALIERIANWLKKINPRPFGIGTGILLIAVIGMFGVNLFIQNMGTKEIPSPTQTREPVVEFTLTSTRTTVTNTVTARLVTSTSTPTRAVSTQTATYSPTHPALTPTPVPLVSPKDGMTLLYVAAGEFTMGSDEHEEDEKPVHTVYLDAFWIDKTEVTNAMFADFLNQQGNQTEGGVTWLKLFNSDERIQLDGSTWQVDSMYLDHPVEYVTWYGARAYCSWVGRKLPAEAEWEKAASWDALNLTKNEYPWGEGIDCSFANFKEDCVGDSSPVGSYPTGASPYGALDMAGNAWEWVDGWYDAYPGNTVSDSDYGTTYRMTRGGKWNLNNLLARSADRYSHFPVQPKGFRCAMDAE